MPGWPGHRAGQHVDLRLTAPDGYQAVRSYSLAGPAEGDVVILAVERFEDGEVSPYLVDEVRVGDRLELRGPVGGHFVWRPEQSEPLVLVARGSGIVPLAAIVRERAAHDTRAVRLLYSARSAEELIYRAELDVRAEDDPSLAVAYTLTRSRPDGRRGYSRRVDDAMLAEVAWPASTGALAYVCGSTGFVEQVAHGRVRLGYPAERVRTERFGPTGV